MKQKSKSNKSVVIGLSIVCAFLVILPMISLLILANLPKLTQAFAGDKIISSHIEEVYVSEDLMGNIDDAFGWLNNTHSPYGKDAIFSLFGIHFYKVDDKTAIFIRPGNAAWFILTKTGNCGEHSDYLADIFERLGYDVRKVHTVGGDHSIIQVLDADRFYFIDPSAQKILNHSTYFENGQWGRIVAITTNETQIDLTKDIISNKTNVSLKQNTTQNVKTSIKSTYLMNHGRIYNKPMFVYQFKSKTDSIIVSAGKKYVLENYRDFGLFGFSIEKEVDLSKDITVYSQDVPATFKNLKINPIVFLIFFLFCGNSTMFWC